MGELWRSEPMELVQIYLQMEAAHNTIDELGKLSVIQFRDLNPGVNNFQRNFINEIKRVDDMTRILNTFQKQLEQDSITPHPVELDSNGDIIGAPNRGPTLDDLEGRLQELERELSEINTNQANLFRTHLELSELRVVLREDSTFFEESGSTTDRNVTVIDTSATAASGLTSSSYGGDLQADPLIRSSQISDDLSSAEAGAAGRGANLNFITGVLPAASLLGFERVLWRVTRGNLFMKTADAEVVDMVAGGATVRKTVFVVFFQGQRAYQKIKKVCEAYGAHLYPCSNSPRERRETLAQVDTRLEDLDTVIRRTKDHRSNILADIAAHFESWRVRLAKEKGIYATMNMFNYDVGRRCLVGEGWVTRSRLDDVRRALQAGMAKSGAEVPSFLNPIATTEQPPTHFRTNKFTYAYQEIVNAYGVARYGEVNPGVFTLITFPFLFGVMFGDIGHGFLLFLFALMLCVKEKQLGKMQLNEMIKTCFDGRYVLLLMGIFSIYTGLIYNELFSVPTDIFGSMWKYNGSHPFAERTDDSYVYPFGVDPAWKGTQNELNYYNSLKMKMSVIIGVTHMMVGIVLSAINATHFKLPYNIWFEFVPQFLFMMCLFGYMCFLIFYKWSVSWEGKSPPFILNTMINMFLSFGSIADKDLIYNGQLHVQQAMVVVAFICVPMMLLPKPLLLRRDHNREEERKRVFRTFHVTSEEEADAVGHHNGGEGASGEHHGHSGGGGGGHGHGEEFEFGEIFVHQIIHTIEFVLGAISNTASYLRLWALSLAHAELSLVFWEDILVRTMKLESFIAIFIGFAIWAGMTAGVLLIMETLSAFLHALRLHWVEFQNKFYLGDGRRFLPFSYQRMLTKGDEEERDAGAQ